MASGLGKQRILFKEMEEIEERIHAHTMETESLIEKRYELLAQREDLEMKEVIECAIESGITPQELMAFVTRTSKEKRKKKTRGSAN